MAGKKYKVNRSNYTLRTRHQLVKGAEVYERDFMTTTNLGGWDSGSIPHGENNFKMVYRDFNNGRKPIEEEGWTEWTAKDVVSGQTEQKSIKIKPNYHSLLDFAYYGNCRQLVSSTIRKIISTFPGEMYVDTSEKITIKTDSATTVGTYYRVRNNFDIDILETTSAKTYTTPSKDSNDTEMTRRAKAKGYEYEDKGIRSLKDNWSDYSAIKVGANQIEEVFDISSYSSSGRTGCSHGDKTGEAKITLSGGGSITIYEIIYENEPCLFVSTASPEWHIRPKQEVIDKFFDGLDDFERMMLNVDTKPSYMMILDYPHDTDFGIKTYRRTFIWPKDGVWNLDITSTTYRDYVNELLNIADLYDTSYTDNLWRMLTHDSIKSMDMAFSNPKNDEDVEDYNIGTTRLEGLMWAIGRQFDEIKRAIGNIKSTPNVSYDESNNVPDYFLSDSLELSGWEVYNLDNALLNNSGSAYTGVTTVRWGDDIYCEKEYTAQDANYVFLRNLKINSKSILKKKGTRDGMVSLLGLFGMEEGKDYTISEYVAKVTSGINQEQFEELVCKMRGEEQDFGYGIPGFPFAKVIVDENNSYLIPWFSKDVKYEGNTYFQMYGGWGKDEKTGEYDETLKYITVVGTTSEMFRLSAERIYDGSICFVENIDEEDEDENDKLHLKHYYILQSVKGNGEIGPDGWRQADENDRPMLEHVSSIVEDFRANNPHVGYGKYDGGQEYIDRINKPFKYNLEHKDDDFMFSDLAYDCDGNLNSGYTNFTVQVETGQEDNQKVWYFGNAIDVEASSHENILKGETKEQVITGNRQSAYTIFDFGKSYRICG